MERRTVLAAVGTLATVGLGGCLGDGDGDNNEAEGPAPNRTASPTETATERETKTPTPDHYTMPAGTAIVEVTVDPDFDGSVVLETTCREDASVLENGEQATVVRNEDRESCGVSVAVDGETAFDEWIAGYESARLTVTADGELEGGRIML